MDKKYSDKLTPEQYAICFLKGTEPPGSGKYYHHFQAGTYHCAACGQKLFDSETKYDSGTGWPAFWDVANPSAISTAIDYSHGMTRTEATCSRCGAHLGHVFSDGPADLSRRQAGKTSRRYCINSLALEFCAQKPIPLSPRGSPRRSRS